LANRYAYETNTTVISVECCQAPEFKPPCAAHQGYAAVKYIYENAEKLGLDSHNIAMFGDGTGAAVCAEVGNILGSKNESKLIRF
jgi:acetyl esterase/lipase